MLEIVKFDESNTLKNLILCDEVSEEISQTLKVANLKIFNLSSLIELGKDLDIDIEFEDPTEDSIFSILGTSGTTGEPKLASLTHRNIFSSFYGISKGAYEFTDEIVYVSYMPLAHLFERIYCLFSLINGAKIGYFSGDMTKLNQAFMTLQPTLIIMVPRLLSRQYDSLMQIIDENDDLKAILEEWNDEPDQNILDEDLNHSLMKHPAIVKCRSLFGGNLKMIVTGGAPNSSNVIRLLRIALS